GLELGILRTRRGKGGAAAAAFGAKREREISQERGKREVQDLGFWFCNCLIPK
ncbi:unnamed protein product, partial [Linum tenue]